MLIWLRSVSAIPAVSGGVKGLGLQRKLILHTFRIVSLKLVSFFRFVIKNKNKLFKNKCSMGSWFRTLTVNPVSD